MKIHRALESSHVAADVLYRRFMRAHFRGIVFNLIAAVAAEPFLRETSVGLATTRTTRRASFQIHRQHDYAFFISPYFTYDYYNNLSMVSKKMR